MLRTTLTAAVALTALTAGTAFADCNSRMGTVEEEYGTYLQSERRANADNARVIQDLRNAARRLSAQGNEEGCEAVVTAIEEVVGGYRSSAEAAASGTATTASGTATTASGTATTASGTATTASGTATAASVETATDLTKEEVQMKAREAVEARVVPLDGNLMLDTSNLKGTNVFNYNDEFLGEVDGMLVMAGKAPTHLIVGHGGFWNIGNEKAAIPFSQVKWDAKRQVFYLNMSEEQLEKAPDYVQKEGHWVPENNDEYYSKLAG